MSDETPVVPEVVVEAPVEVAVPAEGAVEIVPAAL